VRLNGRWNEGNETALPPVPRSAADLRRPGFGLIRISKVTAGDIGAIEEIARVCKLAHWTRAAYLNELSRPDSVFFKATRDGICLGFLLARILKTVNGEVGRDAEIYNIGVAPDEHRKGVGSTLMNALLEECRHRSVNAIWLEARTGNLPAIAFYSKHEFRVVTVRKSFYRDPVEDAIVMRSELYNS